MEQSASTSNDNTTLIGPFSAHSTLLRGIRFFIFCLLTSVTVLSAGSAFADVAIQYHCAGGLQLASNAQLSTLQKVLALPSTTNLGNIALAKVANLLTNSFRLGTNSSSAALVAPLLSDVVQMESLGSFGGASSNNSSFILALHSDAHRAQLWQDNLTKIFGSGGETFKSQQFSGRRWNAGGSHFFWIIPAQDWLLIGCGDDFSTLQADYLNQIRAQGRPAPVLAENWLEADIDSTRLGGWFRLLKPVRISLSVTAIDDSLRIRARMLEAQAIPWKSAPWRMPTDFIRGQVIGFTAGQNVAAFLNASPALARVLSDPLTNQFCFWALDQMPFLNFLAWPVADASNALQRLATQAPDALNPELKRFNGTQLVWHPEAERLVLQNIRLFTPVLGAIHDKDGPFLLLTSYRPSTNGQAAPDKLLAQVQDRTNLVYYDWELTGHRLQEWQLLSKMISNRSNGQNSDTLASMYAEMQWLSATAGLVGSTISEITRVAPNELAVERKAPIGLTALEMILLADWFCDANSGPIHPSPANGNMTPAPSHP